MLIPKVFLNYRLIILHVRNTKQPVIIFLRGFLIMAKKKVFQISNALTEGLEETVIAAHNYTGELRIEVISLKKIELDPDNPRDLILTFHDVMNDILKADPNYTRKIQEKNSLQTLANSIIEQGIINPIVVYKHHDKYRLIAGERRTLASLIAGKSDIQAKILDSKPDELKISLLQWIENIERKDLSLWERLKNLEKMIAAHLKRKSGAPTECRATDLSRLLGCSLPHAMNYLAVLQADNQVKALIQQHQIKNLEKAALIAAIKSEEIKQVAMTACLAGATLKKLKSIVVQEKLKRHTPPSSRLLNNRGRQSTLVNLGTTRNKNAVRVIIDAVLQQKDFMYLKQDFSTVNWSDYKTVSDTFKQLLKTLEQVDA